MNLTHSPAHLVRQMMINEGLVTVSGVWPCYINNELENPDDIVTVFDVAGSLMSRLELEDIVYPGINIRVRGGEYNEAWSKANSIRNFLVGISYAMVEVDMSTYIVKNYTRVQPIISLGRELENQNRDIFSLNCEIVIDREV